MSDVVSSVALPLPFPRTRELAHLVERFFWPLFGAVLALMTFNSFFALEGMHIRDFDEARYGVAASEMLHSHSALVATYAGATEYWNLKPPLGYWLLELSYLVFGETPFALRVPAALSGLALVALTILFARSIAGAGVGLLAGIILATCFGFLGHHAVRSGDLDAPLALSLFPILFLVPRLAAARWARLALGLTLGLAFLLKSFAILPFIAAAAVYGVATGGGGSWRLWVLPLSIAFLIVGTWAVARSAGDSGEFVHRMLVEDLLQRSTSQVDPGKNGPWDYLGCVFDRIAPWPLVILAAMLLARGSTRQGPGSEQWLLVWCYAVIPLVLFTAARTHHSWYIVPTYPGWAILGAASLVDLYRRARSSDARCLCVVAVAVIGLLGCEARIVSQMFFHSRLTAGEVFLVTLGNGYLPRGTRLDLAFEPSYSERFILQVVDGYVLNEADSPTARYRLLNRPQSQTYTLADRKSDWIHTSHVPHHSE
jgi:4-amino-4-deoxy-L-arabinose transferase-like glycosyltransferase